MESQGLGDNGALGSWDLGPWGIGVIGPWGHIGPWIPGQGVKEPCYRYYKAMLCTILYYPQHTLNLKPDLTKV